MASLRVVDFLVDGLRKNTADETRVAQVLFGLGAYVGEVLVRRAGGTWVDFDADERAYFGQPVGVRMPDGRAWNPLGKVRNCFAVGSSEESLRTFYLTLHGRVRRSATPQRSRPPADPLPGSSGRGAGDAARQSPPRRPPQPHGRRQSAGRK
ncbi:hypothetical protein ACFW4M_20250 [Streptomyces sp. NPDC058794]|uniref:hypothetical protein n=1 Tax=unclassified Streptomyces TaxID=2593676 RepID=UPI0036980617